MVEFTYRISTDATTVDVIVSIDGTYIGTGSVILPEDVVAEIVDAGKGVIRAQSEFLQEIADELDP